VVCRGLHTRTSGSEQAGKQRVHTAGRQRGLNTRISGSRQRATHCYPGQQDNKSDRLIVLEKNSAPSRYDSHRRVVALRPSRAARTGLEPARRVRINAAAPGNHVPQAEACAPRGVLPFKLLLPSPTARTPPKKREAVGSPPKPQPCLSRVNLAPCENHYRFHLAPNSSSS